jgi:hypothetical protein
LERGPPAIALDVHLQDGGVVHEPIDGCQRHGLVGENLAPFAERLVGRDEQGSAFIAAAISSNFETLNIRLLPSYRTF